MPAAKFRTAVALLVTTAGLFGAGAVVSNADAARVSSHPSGNASLDAYCSAAADLINQAFSEADRADYMGYYDEGQAWWDTAIGMLSVAKANGCNFSARIRMAGLTRRPGGLVMSADAAPAAAAAGTLTQRVSVRPTGDVRLDGRCRQFAIPINQAFSQGQRDHALALLDQAQQKGCRFLVTTVVEGVAAPGAAAAATVG
jgi:hypothetical protein